MHGHSRPINDPKTQEALNIIAHVFEYYDLAGAVCVVNREEWAYGYNFDTSWSAARDDNELVEKDGMVPLGIRFRAKESELGKERAKELIQGAAFTLTSLLDFGTQTRIWAQDLLNILRRTGIQITYKPFGGHSLPRIHSIDMTK